MNQRNRIFSVITFYSVFLVFLLAPSMSLAGETGPIEIEFLNETKEQTVDTGTLWLVNDNRYNDNKFPIMQIIDGSGTLNISQEFINKQYLGTSQESVQFILALHHGEDVWRRSNIFEEIGNLKNALQSFGEIMVESPDKITVHLSELPKREIKFLKHSGKPLKNQDIQVEYHLFNVGHCNGPISQPLSSQRTNEKGSIRFKAQLEPLLIRKTNFAPQQEPVEGLSFHKYYHLKANSDPDIILQKNWVKPGKKRTFKVKLIDEDGSPIEGASFITDHAIGNHCGATTGFGATTNSDGIAKIQGNPATINAVYIRFQDQKMELSTEQLKQFLTDRDLTVHWKN